MAFDMINSLLEAYIQYLPAYLNEGLIPDEAEYLNTIEKGPLQDDPTQRATFLTVDTDPDADPDGYRQQVGVQRRNRLHVADTAPQYEVGGGFLMINYLKISGWTPRADTKEDGYREIGKFTRRLERALQRMARNELMAGVTTDDGDETTGGMIQVFNLNGTKYKIVGGENEWYGKVSIHFAVYSRVLNHYWQ